MKKIFLILLVIICFILSVVLFKNTKELYTDYKFQLEKSMYYKQSIEKYNFNVDCKKFGLRLKQLNDHFIISRDKLKLSPIYSSNANIYYNLFSKSSDEKYTENNIHPCLD